MRRSLVSVVVVGSVLSLLFAATGCETGGPEDDPRGSTEEVGSDEQPIINGSADTVNDAVCALMTEYQGEYAPFCTTTIIAKNGATAYAISAAHCVEESGLTPDAVACTDTYAECPGAGCKLFLVTNYQTDPEYDGSPSHDLLMLTLGDAASADVIPAIGAVDGLGSGDAIEVSGYGVTDGFSQTPSNRRNHAFSVIGDLYSDAIASPQSHTGQYGGTCFGDSGGPVFVGDGASKRLVGITSQGDENCDQVGYYARTQYLWDFISSYIGELPPQDCLGCANESLGGACAAQYDACNADADCVAFWTCLDACAANDAACAGACQTGHPGGAALYTAMIDCAFCTACDASCQDPACDGATTGTGAGATTGTGAGATTGAGGGAGEGGGASDDDDDDDDDGDRADGGDGTTTVTKCDCAVPGGAAGSSNPALLAGIALAVGLVRRKRRAV